MNWACLRSADGMGAWDSVKEGLSYIRKKPRLMKYYWIGYIILTLISMFVYPVSFLISLALPILSKIFLLVNDEEYG
jgi:hypothetical protein